MPLLVGHALMGASVVAAFGDFTPLLPLDRKRLILLGAALGVLPDLDLFFTWILGMGIKWHGGFTHSIAMAIAVGWLFARYTSPTSLQRVLVLFGAMLSHGLLDWATKKTYGGIQLLWPLTGRRYKLALFDYFAFYPDSKLDPVWKLVLRALQISLYELLIFGGLLLLTLAIRRRLKATQSSQTEGKESELGTPTK